VAPGLCSPRAPAAIRDFHSLDYKGCPNPLELEERLSTFESRWATTVADVIRGEPLRGPLRESLFEFVGVMRMRVPPAKEFIEKFESSVLRSVAKRLEREGKAPKLPHPFEDVSIVDHVTFHIANWKLLQSMFDLGLDPEHVRQLSAMTPTLLRTPAGSAFLTCDQPVALYRPRADLDAAYGIGPAVLGAELSLPLSSQVTLLLSHDAQARASRDLTVAEVHEFNRRTVIMAGAYVFAGERSEEAAALVARYGAQTAGASLDVAETKSGSYFLLRWRPVMPERNNSRDR